MPDHSGERSSAWMAANPAPPRAPAARADPRGPPQPRAHVEDAARGVDAGAPRQRLHGFEAAIVILVQIVEVFGLQALEVLAEAAKRVDDLSLADRVPI